MCHNQVAKREQLEHRTQIVESTLGLGIADISSNRRGKRIKSEPMGASAPAVPQSLQDTGGVGQGESYSTNPSLAVQEMPAASALHWSLYQEYDNQEYNNQAFMHPCWPSSSS